MILILYFIAGMLFCMVASPIVNAFTSLVVSCFEAIQGKVSISIAKSNAEIQDTSDKKFTVSGFE